MLWNKKHQNAKITIFSIIIEVIYFKHLEYVKVRNTNKRKKSETFNNYWHFNINCCSGN